MNENEFDFWFIWFHFVSEKWNWRKVYVSCYTYCLVVIKTQIDSCEFAFFCAIMYENKSIVMIRKFAWILNRVFLSFILLVNVRFFFFSTYSHRVCFTFFIHDIPKITEKISNKANQINAKKMLLSGIFQYLFSFISLRPESDFASMYSNEIWNYR